MENKIFYRRNLPHLQPKGQMFFVTWTLKGAIPKQKKLDLIEEYTQKIKKIKNKEKKDIEHKLYFKKFDALLHSNKSSKHYLRNEKLAQIVSNAILFYDNTRIEVISYTIMSNHVHLVLRMFKQDENGRDIYLRTIMKSIKQYSGTECNKIINKTGTNFWEVESYDRLVRDRAELFRIIAYILDNPVKAKLCKERRDWDFSYIKDKYNEFM